MKVLFSFFNQDRQVYLFFILAFFIGIESFFELSEFFIRLPYLSSLDAYMEVSEISFAFSALGILIFLLFQSEKKENRVQKILNSNMLSWKEIEKQLDYWKLSSTEKIITKMILQGYSNRQIAELRGKSPSTIEAQTNSIYSKSAMNGKIDLLSYFLRECIPELDEE